MEQSIREGFGLADRDVREISSLSLAFLGDSVYELVVRTLLVERAGDRPKVLSQKKSRLVRAQTQAAMADSLREENLLTEEELAVYRRGRNANPSTTARHASLSDYHKATGFESLMGYLYLAGREERLVELVRLGLQYVDEERGERHAERRTD
ncbi:MAG: ribonuclease III [Lachnospiraceae bacterium]|nr:ribonuclease III [Lachnospiraceae bacterium]